MAPSVEAPKPGYIYIYIYMFFGRVPFLRNLRETQRKATFFGWWGGWGCPLTLLAALISFKVVCWRKQLKALGRHPEDSAF